MWLFLQRKQILFPKGQTGGRWWEEGNRVRGQVSTLRLGAAGVWEPLSSPWGGGLRRAVGRPSAESDASGAHKALSSQAAAVGEPQATWHVARVDTCLGGGSSSAIPGDAPSGAGVQPFQPRALGRRVGGGPLPPGNTSQGSGGSPAMQTWGIIPEPPRENCSLISSQQ